MEAVETQEPQDVVVEKYEWRNVLGDAEHKRALTDDGRVLEVYKQTTDPAHGAFAFVWNIFTTPGSSTKWGNTDSLLDAMQKAEMYAWADEGCHESPE